MRIVLLAASLGGVESPVMLSAYSTHYNMSEAELKAAEDGPAVVRVSVGLEDAHDLIAGLHQAPAQNWCAALPAGGGKQGPCARARRRFPRA